MTLLTQYIALHNQGVESGDFAPMLSLFDEAAEMHFERVPYGPLIGRAAIADGFRNTPPDDALILLDAHVDGATTVARYSWERHPTEGILVIEAVNDQIIKLTVR